LITGEFGFVTFVFSECFCLTCHPEPTAEPEVKDPAFWLPLRLFFEFKLLVRCLGSGFVVSLGVPSELLLKEEEDGLKVPCAVSLHNEITASKNRLGKRVARLSSPRMDAICASLRFSLGCDQRQ
jgi:hypothetical protein